VSYQQAAMQAEIADRNAKQAKLNAAAEEKRLRRQQVRQMGAARAFAGASGTTLGGSLLDSLADQAAEAEENALLVRFAGGREAAAYDALRAAAWARATASLIQGGAQVFAGATSQAGTSQSNPASASSGG
jgi:hypothetical protein